MSEKYFRDRLIDASQFINEKTEPHKNLSARAAVRRKTGAPDF